MKTTIETESASVVLLSREAYDVLQAAKTGAALRACELAKMRDKFEARVIKDAAEEKALGYTKYYTVTEVLNLFRETFEIVPTVAPANADGAGEKGGEYTPERPTDLGGADFEKGEE